MKLWVCLPTDFADLRHVGRHSFFAYSSSATCPEKTIEMQQDNLDWFEIEVLRNMTKGQKGKFWPYAA